MKKPTKKFHMQNLSKAITQIVWAKLVIARNGNVGLHNSEQMSEEYREEICKLPTNDLRFILLCAKRRIFDREEATISAITTELLMREVTKEPRVRASSKSSSKRRRRKA